MDIEGAEIMAIEGCKKILKENHTAAAIAAYHVIDGEQTHLKLAPRLRGAGYRVEVLFPEEHLTLYASR